MSAWLGVRGSQVQILSSRQKDKGPLVWTKVQVSGLLYDGPSGVKDSWAGSGQGG
jgi:hypothetical protein